MPEAYVDHIYSESDRSVIILNGSMIEHFITSKLEEHMSALNGEERDRLFGVEGPLGTFSSRNRTAFALGFYERGTSRQIDVIRSMRNAAAHCVATVSFTDLVFVNAIAQITEPKLRGHISGFNGHQLRHFFTIKCCALASKIVNGDTDDSDNRLVAMVLDSPVTSLPDKPAAE